MTESIEDSREGPLELVDEERRRVSRVPIEVLVTYWVDIQGRTEPYEVKSLDLSEDGIFLMIETPLALGTDVLLQFCLPGSPDPLRVGGEIVWVRNRGDSSGGPAGKGIRFKDLEPDSRRRLRSHIEGSP